MGWEVLEPESAELAAQMIRKACLAEGITQSGLVLHSDNGAPMKGATMLATLQQLVVVPSFSRPSVSNDNPYSESLFGSLKYSPAYPAKPFDSIEAAGTWVHTFVTRYNGTHRHSGIQYVTPNQRHQGEDDAILSKRKAVYEAAKAATPSALEWHNQELGQGRGRVPEPGQAGTIGRLRSRGGCNVKNAATILTNVWKAS